MNSSQRTVAADILLQGKYNYRNIMGKKKIKICKIQDQKVCRLTLYKRKKGLLKKGMETIWFPQDSFTDSNLNIPELPEKIFIFPGEDIIPMWTVLILIVCGIFVAEWYFYQRRWIE